mgnify:CR=1 FL=1
MKKFLKKGHVQIYLEVVCLNKNGFADGAYAKWRSLYELSIIATFIKKYGENVAKAFIKSANTEDRYEWAREADCFKDYNKKYITFSAIQDNCEIATKEWKKEYNFVNQLVHASPQGTMYRLGGDTFYSLPVLIFDGWYFFTLDIRTNVLYNRKYRTFVLIW